MTPLQPPRLPLALLRRSIPDNEPLIGDLMEVFEVRRSRLWFWRQSIWAIAIHAWRRDREIRPLRLVDGYPAYADRRADASIRPGRVNLSASPIAGIGGLGLVAFGVLVTVVAPQAWWIAVASIAGGVVLGVTMVMISRRRLAAAPRVGVASVLLGDRGPDSAR